MAEDSDLERTEPASQRRLEQAREEGRVPQSRELSAFLVLLAGVGGFWMLGGWLIRQAGGLLQQGLSFGSRAMLDANGMTSALAAATREAALLLSPFFLLTLTAAVASPMLLGGVVFSGKALAPDFSRIDPLKGMGRIFSMQGVAELVKSVLKAALVGGVVYWVVTRQQDALFALLGQSVDAALSSVGGMVLFAALALVSGVALVAAIDVPFQLWQYYSKLRMTREEVRQEGKEQEGDPQVKGRIRSQQREMARRRMMAEVPSADVVVTNPTHFAVALKYDTARMNAPVVVAKGMNLVAARIRELATEHGVQLVEMPPLARALHRHCELGEQIPAALYTAVAEVMAYVYQLKAYLASDGRDMAVPQALGACSVPPEMDPGMPEEVLGRVQVA